MGIFNKILKKAEEIAVKKHKPPKNYNKKNLKSLSEIKDKITCGSVLLCSGTAGESRLIEEIDGTDFSHAAIIVRLHNTKTLYVWTADTVTVLDDKIHKEKNIKHSGSHLLLLEDYIADLDKIYPSPDGSKYRFAVALLKGIDVDEKKLWSLMYKYDGTPFPSTKDEFLNWLKGQVDINTGMDNSFCAQMVANTYQKMGWMKTNHPPNYYNPGSFAKTEEINKEIINGFLEKPFYFKI